MIVTHFDRRHLPDWQPAPTAQIRNTHIERGRTVEDVFVLFAGRWEWYRVATKPRGLEEFVQFVDDPRQVRVLDRALALPADGRPYVPGTPDYEFAIRGEEARRSYARLTDWEAMTRGRIPRQRSEPLEPDVAGFAVARPEARVLR